MDIPDEAWFQVLLLVSKHSSEDLYSMAGTCKLFQQMLNDLEVWRTVSVQKYQWYPEWYGFDEEKIVEFLQKCKEHKNTEIIYRGAVTQFFILKDDEAVNNFRVAAKAGHMESSYIVDLLGLVNPKEGEQDAVEWLCHLSKMKQIDMQACRASFFHRLMRYTISGVVTPPTLAKFTAPTTFFLPALTVRVIGSGFSNSNGAGRATTLTRYLPGTAVNPANGRGSCTASSANSVR